jgi:hypothetical protein
MHRTTMTLDAHDRTTAAQGYDSVREPMPNVDIGVDAVRGA